MCVKSLYLLISYLKRLEFEYVKISRYLHSCIWIYDYTYFTFLIFYYANLFNIISVRVCVKLKFGIININTIAHMHFFVWLDTHNFFYNNNKPLSHYVGSAIWIVQRHCYLSFTNSLFTNRSHSMWSSSVHFGLPISLLIGFQVIWLNFFTGASISFL